LLLLSLPVIKLTGRYLQREAAKTTFKSVRKQDLSGKLRKFLGELVPWLDATDKTMKSQVRIFRIHLFILGQAHDLQAINPHAMLLISETKMIYPKFYLSGLQRRIEQT
jgi:hypothetical protein